MEVSRVLAQRFSDVVSKTVLSDKCSVYGALVKPNEWLIDKLVQDFSEKRKNTSIEWTKYDIWQHEGLSRPVIHRSVT